jgi:uncharacterized protein (DUF2267 family)
MSSTDVDAIERNVQKTREWLDELAAELGTEDRREAWRVLRAYFHVMRDRLTIEELAHLPAQFPHLLRGVYYEGFDPTDVPVKIRDADTFLTQLAERAQLDDPAQAPRAAAAATTVLRRHVSAGEIDDVMAQLPQDIRSVLQPR